MTTIKEQYLIGERALFHATNYNIENSTFTDGESPLKESKHIQLHNSSFKWKYPLWYSEKITCENVTFLETARSGIWYTNDIKMKNCVIEAPKTFRKTQVIELDHVQFPNAEETLWNCSEIIMRDVFAQGNYFAMNSHNIDITNFTLSGNYAFDGAYKVVIHNATLLSKDAFWNCEDVTVYDSTIIGEYLGWNSKNIRFINCTIDSLQGMCYMENVILENCTLLNTNLAFEYSTVDACITSSINGIKNPMSGNIIAHSIEEIIMEDTYIDPEKTNIEVATHVL